MIERVMVRSGGEPPASRGAPLDGELRAPLERAFREDFSRVRVHAGDDASRAAGALRARAYTVGEDIVFAAGTYAPDTATGRALIAHELAHVAQQRAADARRCGGSAASEEAARAGGEVASEEAARAGGEVASEEAARRQVEALAARRPLDPPVPAPHGIPQRVSIFEKLVRLIGFEGTFGDDELQQYLRDYADRGVIEDAFDSDNKAREITRRFAAGNPRYARTLVRKRVLVQEMLSGYLSDGDQAGIVSILQGSTTAERTAIDAAAHVRAQIGRFDGDAHRSVEQLLAPGRAARERPAAVAPPAPARARFAEDRVAVLPGERDMYTRVLAFLRDSKARIDALLAGGRGSQPWMRADDPAMVEVIRALDGLIGELSAERLIVRFDQPQEGSVAAAYDFTDDLLHIRALAAGDSVAPIAVSILHEYTHALQDRASEAAQAAGRGRTEHTAADELAQERGARKVESYYEVLLSELRLMPVSAALGSTLTARVFVGDFERVAHGTPRERRESSARIDTQLRSAYEGQLRRNAPASEFVIDLDDAYAATLRADPRTGRPLALGTVPVQFDTRTQLIGYLSLQLEHLDQYRSFFRGPRGAAQPIALFTVVMHGNRVAQFALAAPELEPRRGGARVQPSLIAGGVDDEFEREAERIAARPSWDAPPGISAHLRSDAPPPGISAHPRWDAPPPGISARPGSDAPPGISRIRSHVTRAVWDTGTVERVAIERASDREARDVVRAPGRPLDPPTRAVMEARFGYDFSAVRVHADGPAARSAASMGARAYTYGHHIAFGEGMYAPSTSRGAGLLAHELVHVIQQDGLTAPWDRVRVGEAAAEGLYEREAGAHTRALASGQAPGPLSRLGSARIQGSFWDTLWSGIVDVALFIPRLFGLEVGFPAQDLRNYLDGLRQRKGPQRSLFSDNMARACVYREQEFGPYDVQTKSWLVEDMLDGHVSFLDERAIIALMRGSPSGQRQQIVSAVGRPRLWEPFSGQNRRVIEAMTMTASDGGEALVSRLRTLDPSEIADYAANATEPAVREAARRAAALSAITTPVPTGATISKEGTADFVVNGIAITAKPDVITPSLGDHGFTHLELEYDQPLPVQGDVQVEFTAPKIRGTVWSEFPSEEHKRKPSAYGAGTRPGDEPTLRFHERRHGEAWLEFLRSNPPPTFHATSPSPSAAYNAAVKQWLTEVPAYNQRALNYGQQQGDCVGTLPTDEQLAGTGFKASICHQLP